MSEAIKEKDIWCPLYYTGCHHREVRFMNQYKYGCNKEDRDCALRMMISLNKKENKK